jgi:5-methylthioribose kinase
VHCHRNVEAERQAYVAQLFRDTVGFSAAKIIRRILGLAHNIDFELIEDPKRRAAAKRAACGWRGRCWWMRRHLVRSEPSPRGREARDWQPDFGG